jgi:hypothetical protein
MKKTLLTLIVAASSLGVFAQGKVDLLNDGGSLYTMDTNTAALMAADVSLAGQAIPITGPLPSGAVIEVGLYGGVTSTAMTLQTEVLLNPSSGGTGPAPGRGPIVNTHIDGTPNNNGDGSLGMPGYTAGSQVYFQVFVWDSRAATPQLALADGFYEGANNIFQMTPGTSLAYTSIISGGGSTWSTVGNENPLYASVTVPEPTTFALAGLGAAAMLIFRRRK